MHFQQFTTDQRLSENVVYCILQDNRGFIWAGTHHGLNRYDGYVFKKYYSDNSDTTSLSDNSILCMSHDGVGKIWVGTMQGLNHFDPTTGKNKRILMPLKGSDYQVSNIHTLNQNEILVHLGTEIYLFRPKQNQWIKTPLPDSNLLPEFYQLPNGKLGVGNQLRGGFLLYDVKKRAWNYQSSLKGYPVNSNTIVSNYYVDSKANHYLYSSLDSFIIFNEAGKETARLGKQFFKDQLTSTRIIFSEVPDDKTLMATTKGLIEFDHLSGKLSIIEIVGEQSSVSGNKELRCMMVDKDKDVWIGGFGEGILRSRFRKSPFHSIGLEDITQENLGRMIFGLYEWEDGSIAAETTYSNFSIIKNGKKKGFTNAKKLGLSKTVAITLGKKFENLPKEQQRILKRLFSMNSLFPKQFILHDSTGVVLTGTLFVLFTDKTDRILGDYTTKILEDELYYWAATSKGLLRINKKDLSDTTYLNDPSNPHSISENSLYTVTGDDNGNLWVGTKGGGLNYFDTRQEKFLHYTMKDGLPDDVVYFIVPDSSGNLWLSTNNGLSRFNVKNKSFQNFSRRDGLLNSEFNRNGGLLAKDGYMYFSGTSGIDYFKPDEVVGIKNEVASFISEVSVNGFGLNDDKNELKHSQNDITISFTANDFSRPDLVYYRYNLNQNDWTRVQGINRVSYHNLSPGEYIFKVESSYDNLNWSKPAIYTFTITTPWWMSKWFYILLSLLILSVLWMVYRNRINQFKKIQVMRSRISQDLHDEVGATLSSIHIYSSVATKAMTIDSGKAHEALEQINLNSRQVMENMNDIVWALNTRNPGETSFETKLKTYSYDLLAPLNIYCSFSIDKEAEKKLNNLDARKNILLIAKEAINNIAKHSKATRVSIQLGLKGKDLFLFIKDNGIGINPHSSLNGNGLNNMENRIRNLGGKFFYETSTEGGTDICCIIPLTKIR